MRLSKQNTDGDTRVADPFRVAVAKSERNSHEVGPVLPTSSVRDYRFHRQEERERERATKSLFRQTARLVDGREQIM